MALRALMTRKALTGGLGLGSQTIRAMQTFSHSLPNLPYDYGALEPVISAEIMKLHHQKHHQTYVTNLTSPTTTKPSSSSSTSWTKATLRPSLDCRAPSSSMAEVITNHSIFWKNLAPVREGGGDPPEGSLGLAIDTHFGSLESLIVKMNAEGAALQGSGWVWLGLDTEFNRLLVETTENQDPLVTKGANLVPLLGIDVWEHAYYLQYKNVKPDYLKSIWHVMNWKYASEVYETECP